MVLYTKIKQKDAVEYVAELLKYRGDENLLEQFKKWQIPRFPINGKILKDAGVSPGKSYGPIIHKLKEIWIENEYKQTTEDLVKFIPEFVDDFNLKQK